MKKKVISIMSVIIGILIVGQIYFSYFYSYYGRVIDADTKAPIEGAVVVASWREERPAIAGPTSKVKDVKETLTDKNGEWSIRGARGERLGLSTLLSYITSFFTGYVLGTYATQKPEFIVFKPGYCSWPKGFEIDACREKIKIYNPNRSNNIGGLVELPKLTNREDRLKAQRISLYTDKASEKKVANFFRLLNEEARHLGIPENPEYKELERELVHEK